MKLRWRQVPRPLQGQVRNRSFGFALAQVGLGRLHARAACSRCA